MKRQKKNLNEEIERIKSLFTDERLYGNLVEQGILKKIGGKIGTGYQNVKSAIQKKQAEKAAMQKALGKTTHKQKSATEDKREAAAKVEREAAKLQKKKCHKGIRFLANNFLNYDPQRRPTIDEYIAQLQGVDDAEKQNIWTGITANFEICKVDPKIIDLYGNMDYAKFGDKTVLATLDDIINNGDLTYKDVPGQEKDYLDLVQSRVKRTVDKTKEFVKDATTDPAKARGDKFKVKDKNNKNIGIITTTKIPNQYKFDGGKKIYILNPGLKDVNYMYLPDILKSLKKPKGKLSLVANTGKREKFKDSFEFTIA